MIFVLFLDVLAIPLAAEIEKKLVGECVLYPILYFILRSGKEKF